MKIRKLKLSREERVSNAVSRFLVTNGIPGASVGVSVNGRLVLAEGYGFADVENGHPCTKDTVMRIASISKPITSTIAAKLLEMGKLDLDKSIYALVPDFPKKKVENKEVDITIRQLLNHTSGVRHYKKIYEETDLNKIDKLFENYGQDEKDAEALYRKFYPTTEDAVNMFKADDLLFKPGAKFSYTTHGYTLLGWCLEKASGETFDRLAFKLFNELGMHNTCVDQNEPITPNRAKFYRRNARHLLVNVPEVDCSYKHPSGGILSNVEDLLKFANAMLQSYQATDSSQTFLKPSTVDEFWNNVGIASSDYALGWSQWPVSCVNKQTNWNQIWYHTGAAVGASSILLIKSDRHLTNQTYPQGICVAILVNMYGIDTRSLAKEIVDIFEQYNN
ncbi:Beta-lactamase domain-containing protein [Aphelenchoides bicaudatus]|nr:Beta-lactamase domain-containing protein [Aphelenchoides bicaudatus]